MRLARALDALNSAFLFADSGFLLHGLWQLSHAGDARAISLPQYLFFMVWQLFGVGYLRSPRKALVCHRVRIRYDRSDHFFHDGLVFPNAPGRGRAPMIDNTLLAAFITLGVGVAASALGTAASWGWTKHKLKTAEEKANAAVEAAAANASAIGAHREFVALNYVQKDTIEQIETRNNQMFSELRTALDNGFRSVTDRIDKLFVQRSDGA